MPKLFQLRSCNFDRMFPSCVHPKSKTTKVHDWFKRYGDVKWAVGKDVIFARGWSCHWEGLATNPSSKNIYKKKCL